MSNVIEKDGFVIHLDRLEALFRETMGAVDKREGVFQKGLHSFLPQWNLPESMEYKPQQKEVRRHVDAARFLFTRVTLDRLAVSDFLHTQMHRAWNDDTRRWIFSPEKVARRPVAIIDEVLKNYFSYSLPVSKEMSIGAAYHANCLLLNTNYQSDARMLIQDLPVEQARKNLMQLKGFGTGLANLYLLETYSRGITRVSDPESLLPKIDRHKARIPLNTGIVDLRNGNHATGIIHAGGAFVDALEEAYKRTAQKLGIDLHDIDAALWIIGSKLCVQKDYYACGGCPFRGKACRSRVELFEESGSYQVHAPGNENDRVETRLHIHQGELF